LKKFQITLIPLRIKEALRFIREGILVNFSSKSIFLGLGLVAGQQVVDLYIKEHPLLVIIRYI